MPSKRASKSTTKTNNTAAKAELLSFSEADARVDGALSAAFEGGYQTVLFVDGDLKLDGDLLAALTKTTKAEFDILAVTGDLDVTGRIALYESTPGLWVSGHTTAETLEGGDCEIAIGTGTFKHFVYGYYNDGILDTGDVDAPFVINSNHDLRVPKQKGAKWIDNFGDDDDCDFTSANIGQSFVRDVLSKDGTEVDVPKFLAALRQGKAVLVAGAMTAGEKALADVAKALDDKVYELDMSDKKLKSFPSNVLKMPWLKKLVLDKNAIGNVPKEIGRLTELEHLSLVDCELASLPAEIGKLKKLRVLRVAGNMPYGKRGSTPIVLPKTLGDLSNLEELDVSELSQVPDGKEDERLPELTVFALPASASKLKRLKRLVADHTNLAIPKAMEGLPSLEAISMSGGSWAYLRRFPEFVTTFPNLVSLDVSCNFFPKVPASLTKLTRLEVLDLHNALGMLQAPLPNLSKLKALRVLKLSGNTGHTGVPVPPHERLKPLFAMSLPKLEELAIDRWGGGKGDRGPLPTTVLEGIGRMRSLRVLDLEFDGLTALPDDFFALPALRDLKLSYNALAKKERERIAKAFPDARIDFRNQRGADDATKKKEHKSLAAANALIQKGNSQRSQQKYDAAKKTYAAALRLFKKGTAESAYMELYAHYGRMWIDGKRGHGSDGSKSDREKWRREGLLEAEACLRLVPPVWQIFHFTDEGEFQREVVRYATNFIAWELQSNAKATPTDLARALEVIDRGVACLRSGQDHHILDTKARVLIKLGRQDEAWLLVERILREEPNFRDVADLAKDPRYIAWARGR